MKKFDFKLFFKDSLFNILIGAFISLSGFFYNWVYVDSLGLKDYGTLVAANTYSAVLLVILSISNQSLFSRIMADDSEVNKDKINLFTFFIFQFLHIICIFIIWHMFINFFPTFFSHKINRYSNYIFSIAALNSFSAIPLGYFLGKNFFKKYRFYSGIGIIILFFLLVIFILNKKTDLQSVLIVQLISAFFVGFFSVKFIFHNSLFRFDFSLLRIGLKYSLPIFFYTIFSILSDFYIKINLEKDFNSLILAKYNVILLVSSLPIIFATAINSIFIQKILIYNDHEKRGLIINFTAKIILSLVFLSVFLLISFKSFIFSFFNILLDQYECLLFYFFLSVNTFINFCWLQISNELSIHKITNGFYIASLLSFLITYFSFNFFTSEFFILGAGLTLVLSNFIIFFVAYIYARNKVDILVKFKPLINLYLVFIILVIFFYFLNNIAGLNKKLISIFVNCIIFILMSSYLFNLKNKFKL